MKTVTIENITDIVINAMAEETNPRAKEVLASFIRHMHDFVRETRLPALSLWRRALRNR